jgi:hypothetical protein
MRLASRLDLVVKCAFGETARRASSFTTASEIPRNDSEGRALRRWTCMAGTAPLGVRMLEAVSPTRSEPPRVSRIAGVKCSSAPRPPFIVSCLLSRRAALLRALSRRIWSRLSTEWRMKGLPIHHRNQVGRRELVHRVGPTRRSRSARSVISTFRGRIRSAPSSMAKSMASSTRSG